MIALRPPSYHTIEDPPPYPDDDDDGDDDGRPLAGVGDKRPTRQQDSSNHAGVDRHLANSSELLQLQHHEDPDQPTSDEAIRQFRDAVGRRRRTDPPTCRHSVVSHNHSCNKRL